jgi:hypothetical protein
MPKAPEILDILAADQGSATGEAGEFAGGGEVFSADSSILKNVRVVTTVQYYLDK